MCKLMTIAWCWPYGRWYVKSNFTWTTESDYHVCERPSLFNAIMELRSLKRVSNVHLSSLFFVISRKIGIPVNNWDCYPYIELCSVLTDANGHWNDFTKNWRYSAFELSIAQVGEFGTSVRGCNDFFLAGSCFLLQFFVLCNLVSDTCQHIFGDTRYFLVFKMRSWLFSRH